jgi:hypothetical protein
MKEIDKETEDRSWGEGLLKEEADRKVDEECLVNNDPSWAEKEIDLPDLEEELEWREGRVSTYKMPGWIWHEEYDVEADKKRIAEILEIFHVHEYTRKQQRYS